MLPPLQVHLTEPPSLRWRGLKPFVRQARQLVDVYVRDLGGLERFRGLLDEYRASFVDEAFRPEIDGVAAKDVALTPYERVWTQIVRPFAQTKSMRTPLVQVATCEANGVNPLA
jgi:hypothetical protein